MGRDGNHFYYNAKTGESCSDLPQDKIRDSENAKEADVIFRGVQKSSIGSGNGDRNKYDVNAKWSSKRSKKMQDGA
jgi:hypothetical protein